VDAVLAFLAAGVAGLPSAGRLAVVASVASLLVPLGADDAAGFAESAPPLSVAVVAGVSILNRIL
jgi:hypothetical protein